MRGATERRRFRSRDAIISKRKGGDYWSIFWDTRKMALWLALMKTTFCL